MIRWSAPFEFGMGATRRRLAQNRLCPAAAYPTAGGVRGRRASHPIGGIACLALDRRRVATAVHTSIRDHPAHGAGLIGSGRPYYARTDDSVHPTGNR